MTTVLTGLESALERLIPQFYERICADAVLGPIFTGAVADWPAHHAQLIDFWSSIMLTTGRYKGNPVAVHARHRDRLTPAMFDRWLAIWEQTTEEMMPPADARALQAKAARIAESLKLALFFKLPPPPIRGLDPMTGAIRIQAAPVPSRDYRGDPVDGKS